MGLLGGSALNSTVKSLLFWVALVVIAVLIYNVSTKFQQQDHTISFSQFMSLVDQNNVSNVTITGPDITGTTKSNEPFHLYAPSQFDGLANRLVDHGVQVKAREATASPWSTLLYTWG